MDERWHARPQMVACCGPCRGVTWPFHSHRGRASYTPLSKREWSAWVASRKVRDLSCQSEGNGHIRIAKESWATVLGRCWDWQNTFTLDTSGCKPRELKAVRFSLLLHQPSTLPKLGGLVSGGLSIKFGSVSNRVEVGRDGMNGRMERQRNQRVDGGMREMSWGGMEWVDGRKG